MRLLLGAATRGAAPFSPCGLGAAEGGGYFLVGRDEARGFAEMAAGVVGATQGLEHEGEMVVGATMPGASGARRLTDTDPYGAVTIFRTSQAGVVFFTTIWRSICFFFPSSS